MRLKTINFLALAGLLLSSCTQTADRVTIHEKSGVVTLADTSDSDQDLAKYKQFAKAAPNPENCKDDIDFCHFKYLNQRSFSILKNAKNNNTNDIGGGHGTGWFLDREVGTNNFWIATNVHVGTNLTDSEVKIPEKDLKQPDQIDLQIGKQDILPENNNSRVDVLLDSNFKSVQYAPTYYDDNNRLVLQSNTFSYTAPTVENSDTNGLGYFLNLKKLSSDYFTSQIFELNNFGRISESLSEDFFKIRINSFNSRLQIIAPQFAASFGNSFQSDFFGQNAIFNLNSIWSSFFESIKDQTNGVSSNTQLITDANKVPYQHLDEAEKSLLKSLYTPNLVSHKTFIDAMIMKVHIDNDILAHWFPYFLDPTTYNEWTFPRFKEAGKIDISKASDANANFLSQSVAPTNESDVNQKYYRAGYPVEQVNGSLIYNSKGGPIFKTTVLSPLLLEYPDAMNAPRYNPLDHLQVEPNSNIDSPNNNAKLVGFDLYGKVSSGASREAGGGSSGSLVIDKDYNVVGIHWGSLSDRFSSVYNREPGLGIFTAFNVPNNANRDVVRTFGLSQVEKNQQDNFRSIALKTLFNIYAKDLAQKILTKYNAITDKNNKGIDFDNSNTLFDDIEKTNKGEMTNKSEVATTNNTEEKKKQAIVNALWVKAKSHYGSNQFSYLDTLTTLSKTDLDYLNRFGFLNISVKGTGSLGYTDIKGQLENYFKSKNIHTYNFNKVVSA